MGEDVATSAIAMTGNMINEFGLDRVRDTPLSEEGFVGAAVGAALGGLKPIVDLRLFNFTYLAMDQIIDQAAKTRYMYGMQIKMPIVIRGGCGWMPGVGAQHSDSPHAMFMTAPGLKIVVPSTPYDAKGLLKTAIRDDNPVLFFEFIALRAGKSMVPDEEYLVPFGKADVKRVGSDVTVVGIGPMVQKALAVAEELAKEGISVEVVDPRTLVPLDKETIRASVQKTGRLVIADDAHGTAGATAEIAAMIFEDEDTFGCLEAPVQRVARPNVPIPYSSPMELFVVPDANQIKKAVLKVMK